MAPGADLTDRMGNSDAFLGVTRSASGRKWTGLSAEHERLAGGIEQQTGLPALLSRILARQGVPAEFVDHYLDPKLRDLIPDPSSLLDMDRAVDRFVTAIKNRQRIAIFADYDVDGGCSSALLVTWLRHFGMASTVYIPDRLKEGFGPNVPAMKELSKRHDLIVCVDCGTVAHESIAAAGNVDVIVLDHHTSDETLPPAFAVVNPNRQDESTELNYLCAAGVVFMFLVAANRAMRPTGRSLPDLMRFLDLVALATVADVSPLLGLNRALVRSGLNVLRKRQRPGLRALADRADLRAAPTSYHLGFVFGPRINAGGRIGDTSLGARLLSTESDQEAEALAAQLEELNSRRRDMVDAVSAEARQIIEQGGLESPLAWAASNKFHPGVVGIAASRLVELANRPAVVMAIGDGTATGSARSIVGIDIGAAVLRCHREGLLVRGGGHKMAAGLTVEVSKLNEVMARLTEIVAFQGAEVLARPVLRVDGLLQPSGISVELIEDLEKAGPFGAGSPEPTVVLSNQIIKWPRKVGSSHLQFTLEDVSGARLRAIAFRAMDSPLGDALFNSGSMAVHVAGTLTINEFRGNAAPNIRVVDACLA